MYKKLSIALIAIIATVSFFCYLSSEFGRYYDGKVSDHFDGMRFFDPEVNSNKNFFDFLKWQLEKETPDDSSWSKKVPNIQYDVPPSRVMGSDLRVSYVGHVTFLIQTQGLNILTDPVWYDRASPFSFVGPKRVIDPGIKFEDLPPIDIIWVSHNHYDHLDSETINRLWKKYKPRIITPLGNDIVIRRYNFAIQAEGYDWGDKVVINDDVSFHIEPMQHWSARGIFDRNKALWGALNIETKSGNIYFVGDSGYGEGRYFKKAKEKFGEFRLALLPMGAYEPRSLMKYPHMNPEDMVRAHIDLGSPFTIPCHYDVFKLTDEPRGDALVNLEKAKKLLSDGKKIKTLEPGQFCLVPLYTHHE